MAAGAVLGIIGSLLNSNQGGSGGSGGGGGLGGYINLAGKDTYTKTKYGVAQNLFDPGGVTGLWDDKKKKGKSPLEQYLELAGGIRSFVQEDPMYTKPQEQLYGLGTALTTGENLPEWLRPLTEAGSDELENVISRASSDITKRSIEGAAIQGTRTGRNIPALNKSIADFSSNLRYQDLLHTQGNIRSLFGSGLDTLANVRNTALSLGSLGASQGQGLFNTLLNQQNIENQATASAGASTGGAIGSILGAFGGGRGAEPSDMPRTGFGTSYGNTAQFGQVGTGNLGSAQGTTAWKSPTGQRFIV